MRSTSCGDKKKKKRNNVLLSIFLLTRDPSVVLKCLEFVDFVICCFRFVVLGVCLFLFFSIFFLSPQPCPGEKKEPVFGGAGGAEPESTDVVGRLATAMGQRLVLPWGC